LDGVPTEITEISVVATASATLVVARRRPALIAAASRSPISSSTIGDRPLFINATLPSLTSMPITSNPSFAKQPHDTAPTYPSPNTLTRIVAT